MRDIPRQAIDLVARWEDCVLTAYPDPATGGEPWTIGFGHTGAVKPGDVVNKDQAVALLQVDLRIAAGRIAARIGPVVDELTDNQYAALLSFVFNLGATPSWTIWKRLKARQFDQVPGELIKFVNANGKKMQGLVNRRTDEIRLWSTDEPGSHDAPLTSAVTRAIVTPPTPADPVAPAKSATLITGVLGVASTVPVAAKQVMDTVEPYRDAAPIIGQVVAVLAAIAAGAAVIVLVLNWLKKQEARR